jgi:hypothetical protein
MASRKSHQPDPRKGFSGKGPLEGVLDHVLPPDPRPPERPTIPPPNCGTLPPKVPPLGDLLGGKGGGWPF